MIAYKRVSRTSELEQILDLQSRNMAKVLSAGEIKKEGFITVGHTFDILEKMNSASPHIIAYTSQGIVGYALVMLPSFRNEIPELTPMFEAADRLLPNSNYLAMGQICIDRDYRKMGVFKGMYSFYKEVFHREFDGLVTEVATTNQRSLAAHRSAGFEILNTRVAKGTSWELIYWDWSGAK